MAKIKQIKLPSGQVYDISAKYDVNGNLIIETYATKTDLANLVDTAPEALNTLNELSAALGDDPNFSTTVLTKIGVLEEKTEAITLEEIDAICGTVIEMASEVMF